MCNARAANWSGSEREDGPREPEVLRAVRGLDDLSQAQGRGIETAKYLFAPDQLALTGWQQLDHAQLLTANGGATVKDGASVLSGTVSYGSGLRTGPDNTEHVPGWVRVDLTLQHTFLDSPLTPVVAVDVVNLLDAHYAYRIANGFVGSTYAPGRSAYVRASVSF